MAADPNNSISVAGHVTAYTPDGAQKMSISSAVTDYADAAAIQAIASTTRTDGMVVTKLDDSTPWIFDAESSAAASAWVLVPDAGTGRWLRKVVTTTDLATTGSATLGANLVGIRDVATIITATTVEGALAEVAQFEADLGSATAGKGASKVALEAIAGTAATTPQEALEELYTDALSGLEIIRIGPMNFTQLVDGTPLPVFADGASTIAGIYSDGAKVVGVRWNNDAAPAAIVASIQIPPQVDVTANAVLHIRAAKTGATNNAGNTPTFVVTATNQVDGALYDADANFGGTSSAMVANATAKTIQNVTRALALADLAAYPASVSISIKPTAGTLDTDDLVLLDAYLVCKRKLRTS